jgi:hypothetical protein
MANLDLCSLRDASPAEVAAQLRSTASRADDVLDLTNEVVSCIAGGSLPFPVAQTWLSIVDKPQATVICLRQAQSVLVRRVAIRRLVKQLRQDKTLSSAWDAIGGARGLVSVLATLSVIDVRRLCYALGWTASSSGNDVVRLQRQRRVTELLEMLLSRDENPDSRPLHAAYARLVPACTQEIALEWLDMMDSSSLPSSVRASAAIDSNETMFSEQLRSHIVKAHWDAVKQRALNSIFSGSGTFTLDIIKPFVKADTAFAVRVLADLAQHEALMRVDPWSFVGSLVIPIFKRTARHRADPDAHRSIGRLVIRCIEQKPALKAHFRPRVYGQTDETLVSAAIRSWNSSPFRPEDDEILGRILRFLPMEWLSLPLPFLIDLVRPSRRYHFLQLVLRNHHAYDVDIGPPTSKYGISIGKAKIHGYVFEALPPAQASALFERLLEGNPEFTFLGWSSKSRNDSVFMEPLEYLDTRYPNPHTFRAELIKRTDPKDRILPEDPGAVLQDLRTKELARLMKKAAQSKEQEERCHYATAALRLCMAIGDLDLYNETLQWAGKRFSKDPLTVKELYSDSVMNTVEAVIMLIALDERPRALTDIKDAMQKANGVLLTLLETATMAQREPSFSVHHWDAVLDMPSSIAAKRLFLLDKWQRKMGMSDTDVLENVLEPMMEMLLEVEETLLKPDRRRLNRQNPEGILAGKGLVFSGSTSRATIQFLDRLAQRRDELWRRHRGQVNPSVMSLGAPWPRGLPIQSLLSTSFAVHQGLYYMIYAKMPYIQGRAEAVVFCGAETALAPIPEREEDQTAVGPFVESWITALEFWLIGADDRADREKRALRAWQHATTELTGGRMTREEAHRFWRRRSNLWSDLAQLSEPESKREMALLPKSDDSGQPSEWNPDPQRGEPDMVAKDRRLPATTCLDCMLEPNVLRGESWKTTRILTRVSDPQVPGNPIPASYWSSSKADWHGVSISQVDAAGATAVLCVNSIAGADTSLLMTSLPSDAEPRFPALYLDEGFLENEGSKIDPPLQVLQDLHKLLPSQLLVKLADSVLQRIQAEENEGLRNYAAFVEVIKLLARGDDPMLVAPLLRRFIVENPEASAWHRSVLNSGIVRFLDPRGSEQLFQSLSSAILDNLKQQSASKADAAPADDASPSALPPPSLVKVTTVKMMARILHGGLFLGPTASLDILGQLLAHANHIDIRLAALESLINMSRNAQIKDAVLEQLRQYAVPLAGALSEQHPATESDWEAAEERGQLPTVGHGHNDHRAYDMLSHGNEETNPDLYSLAYEAMERSGRDNKRWMLLFMKKHGIDIKSDVIPQIPAMPRFYASLFRLTRASKLQRAHFDTMSHFITLLADPPSEITQITALVKSKDSLASSNEGAHWLAVWDGHETSGLLCGLHIFLGHVNELAALQRERRSGAVTSDMMDAFVLRTLRTRLAQGDTGFCLRILSYMSSRYDAETHGVREDMGPGRILRGLIDSINAMRTPEWQADPNRQPAFLPRTLEFELALLPTHPRDVPIEYIVRYVDDIVALLGKVVSSGMPYDERIDSVTNHLYRSTSSWLRLACLFGTPGRLSNPESLAPVDFLRLHLAQHLLTNVTSVEDRNEEDLADAKHMVVEWERSPVEELRLVARRLREKSKTGNKRGRALGPKWLFER